MKLFLASEVKNPKTIKKLEGYIGGFAGKKIAYIPTAANGEGWGSWKSGGSWNLVRKLKAKVTLFQLEDYKTSNIEDVLRGKDIIWFAGGYCGYLMYWIRRTGTDELLRDLLRRNCLYVGSSAGSMVAGRSLNVAEWYFTDEEIGASVIPSLKLVDFDILPHYQGNNLKRIKERYKGKKLYLLKDSEEIIVEDKKVTVIGKERVVLGH